ncbi:O-acetylhomoserine aminocarboxypropyltransferase/cysteine synthase family protein [Thorsellia kenyensis]|uniref:O-acetylhomoserine aminocarboxypropyltransferase/cysteine synthase family protein n=1 Tax=Thorsellia kenyensis TaxID=1549888 RepID=A0ABV6CBF1_9GAMM
MSKPEINETEFNLKNNWKPETLSLHAGYDANEHQRSAALPIYQTASYLFDNAEHGANLFNLAEAGFIYTRTGNPTLDILEKRIAALEGGVGAVTFATGMAAIDAAISTIVSHGDDIIASKEIYGGTHNFFRDVLPSRGINVQQFPIDDLMALENLIKPTTKAIFVESISNPSTRIADLPRISAIAKRYGIPLIVDNTVASPIGINALELGANIVIHSLTKYIAGHGNTLGGIVVDGGNFEWNDYKEKYPALSTPSKAYHGIIFNETFKELAYIVKVRTSPLRSSGAALAPHSAFLIAQGLETLSLRYERISHNTLKIVEFLSLHPKVISVHHPSHTHHPDHELAKQLLNHNGAPGIISFEIDGLAEEVTLFYNKLSLFLRLVNIGDNKSLAAIPAQTTHRQLDNEELKAAGISENLVRLSIGIENIDDLIDDLKQALS